MTQIDLLQILKSCPPESIIDGFREVGKDEFYKVIGPQNVHPKPVGDFPYSSEFKTPQHVIKGIVTESFLKGKYPIIKRYFLKD